LACRNLLLDSAKRVKVADFGMARQMKQDSEYYRSHTAQVPLRWTAPEALQSQKFTRANDVWALGVTFYEMWTRVATPYNGWDGRRVWLEVSAGYRLPKPQRCVDQMYALMLRCWHQAPEQRPTAASLEKELRELFRQRTGKDANASPETLAAVVDLELVDDEALHASTDLQIDSKSVGAGTLYTNEGTSSPVGTLLDGQQHAALWQQQQLQQQQQHHSKGSNHASSDCRGCSRGDSSGREYEYSNSSRTFGHSSSGQASAVYQYVSSAVTTSLVD
jgi:serine/threonine protein kinase